MRREQIYTIPALRSHVSLFYLPRSNDDTYNYKLCVNLEETLIIRVSLTVLILVVNIRLKRKESRIEARLADAATDKDLLKRT